MTQALDAALSTSLDNERHGKDRETVIEEVRWYQARPGRRDELVALMDEHVIPFMEAHGMTVVGSYLDVDDAAGYV